MKKKCPLTPRVRCKATARRDQQRKRGFVCLSGAETESAFAVYPAAGARLPSRSIFTMISHHWQLSQIGLSAEWDALSDLVSVHGPV